MRKVLLAFALVLGAMAFNATPAFAGGADTCPTNDGKYEADNDAPGDSPAPGITVTSESENSVTFTVAAGTTLVSLCVKSGNNLSGHSVSCSPDATFPVDGPATCTVTTSGQGNGISHLSFDVTSGGGSTSTSTATTGGGDTSTATTGGGDTSTATTGGGDTSTATTGGGDTGTTTGSTAAAAATTTGGGDAGGGGGGGAGGGGGGGGGSGELPFTGLPVLIPLLLGGALLGSGLVLLRRGRQED